MNRLSMLQFEGDFKEQYTGYVLIILSFVVLWLSLYVPIFDGDIWFHLLYGKYMIENHTLIPDHTLFSWTPSSNETIYCSWIGQILYYLLFEFFGEIGVIAFRFIVATVSIVAVYHLAWHRKTILNPLVPFSISLCTLVMSVAILDKPEILSFLLMTALVCNWYWIKLTYTKVYSKIYLFPILMLVWVNTHGLFLFGCLFLFCVGVGETLNQAIYKVNALPRKLFCHLMLSLIISAGTLVITPYGYKYVASTLMTFFDKDLFSDYSSIGAFQNTFSYGILNFTLFADAAIMLTVIVMFLALKKRKMDFVPILSNLVFAYLYTVYGRLTFLWLPVFSLSIVFFCPSLTLKKTVRGSVVYVMTVLATLLVFCAIFYQNIKNPPKERWLDFSDSETFTMEEELDFINENYPTETLGNFYNYGGYILWKSWPERKVMIDQRYFPFRNWFNDYMLFENGRNLESFTNEFKFDIIAVPHKKQDVILWFCKNEQWESVFYGKSVIVFVRSHLKPRVTNQAISIGQMDFSDIKSFNTAQLVFGTALRLNDFDGADAVIDIMKNKFPHNSNRKYIPGYQLLKEATQSYISKKYSSAIELYEKALKFNVIYPDLYSGALLMQSINDWNNYHWSSASKKMLQSVLNKESFENTYNFGIMACKISEMGQNDQAAARQNLDDAEINVLEKWQEVLKKLSNNYSGVVEYSKEIDNIRTILQDENNCGFDFMEPGWLITTKKGVQ